MGSRPHRALVIAAVCVLCNHLPPDERGPHVEHMPHTHQEYLFGAGATVGSFISQGSNIRFAFPRDDGS